MRPARLLLSGLVGGAALIAVSCREPGLTAPDRQLPVLEASSVNSPEGLLRCRPLAYDSVTKKIGPRGGSIKVSRHVLVIPPLALTGPVALTLVAPSDTLNRIQARPEGLAFQWPASLTMSYANCNHSVLPKRIAYTDDSLVILEYVPSVDDPSKRKVTGQIKHFSEYGISW